MLVSKIQITPEPPLTYEKATLIYHKDVFYVVYTYGSNNKKIEDDRNYITEVFQVTPTLNSGNPLQWDRGQIIYQREVPTPEDQLADEVHNHAVSKYSKWF